MLGGDVFRTFSDEYKTVLATDIDTNEDWLEYLDVRDNNACSKLVKDFQPDLILHLAALTDLEYCETEKDDAWSTNALGSQYMADLALQNDSTIAYISTAGIFDGKKDEYSEADLPNPINQYGKSKYHGEKYIISNCPKHFVFRAGWMMGGGPKKDKKFINKIISKIRAGETELFIVDDKSGTPTYTKDFAVGMASTIRSGSYGLFNQVCSGSTSRYEVTVAMLEFLGLTEQVIITKVGSDYFKETYFATRPRSEILINAHLDELDLNSMRHWKVCLKEYLKEFE